jgi:hypothetical protein
MSPGKCKFESVIECGGEGADECLISSRCQVLSRDDSMPLDRATGFSEMAFEHTANGLPKELIEQANQSGKRSTEGTKRVGLG